jgi:hypothetical protein
MGAPGCVCYKVRCGPCATLTNTGTHTTSSRLWRLPLPLLCTCAHLACALKPPRAHPTSVVAPRRGGKHRVFFIVHPPPSLCPSACAPCRGMPLPPSPMTPIPPRLATRICSNHILCAFPPHMHSTHTLELHFLPPRPPPPCAHATRCLSTQTPSPVQHVYHPHPTHMHTLGQPPGTPSPLTFVDHPLFFGPRPTPPPPPCASTKVRAPAHTLWPAPCIWPSHPSYIQTAVRPHRTPSPLTFLPACHPHPTFLSVAGCESAAKD